MKKIIIFVLLLGFSYSFGQAQEKIDFKNSFSLKNLKFNNHRLDKSSVGELDKIISKLKVDDNLRVQVKAFADKNTPDGKVKVVAKSLIKEVQRYFQSKKIPLYKVVGVPSTTKSAGNAKIDIALGNNVIDTEFKKPVAIKGIKFSSMSDTLYASSYATLNKLARTMNKKKSMKVKFITHVFSYAGADYNKTISDKQAIAIKNYLVKQRVSPDRIKYLGMGDKKPIVLNETQADLEKNSRVELAIKP